MDISFTLEHTNLLIILLSLVVILFIISRRFSKKRAIRFGNFETLQKVVGRQFLSYSIVPLILRILILVFIILGLSNPVIVFKTLSSNTDYVIALDVSSSMLTPDIKPNRLEAAKKAIIDFVEGYDYGSVGLVSFSGEARIESNLKRDKEELIKIINNIEIGKVAGTSIGDALITSASILSESKNNKTIILITDGRNNVGISLNKTYQYLKDKNIKVIAIGIGSEKKLNETAIPEEIKKYNATIAEYPTLDEKTLKQLANVTGGRFYKVTNLNSLKDALQSSTKKELLRLNIQFYLLLFACLLILIDWALETTRYRVLP